MSLYERKSHILAVFCNQILGNNSCQKQCVLKIALRNVKTFFFFFFFHCNLIYKLKLIKQNVIFCLFFHINK